MFKNKVLITRTNRTTTLGLTVYRFLGHDIVLNSKIKEIDIPILQEEWNKIRNTVIPIGNDIGIYLHDWENFTQHLGF